MRFNLKILSPGKDFRRSLKMLMDKRCIEIHFILKNGMTMDTRPEFNRVVLHITFFLPNLMKKV